MARYALPLDDYTFDYAIGDGVTLVGFWCPCCAPCRMLNPVLDQVAQAVDGRATVAKVNMDESTALKSRFDIRSLPTLILFINGKPQKRLSGFNPAEHLTAKIESALADESKSALKCVS